MVGEGHKNHHFIPLHHGQGCHSLDQVAESPIYPDPEHFQELGKHSFSGQLVPVSHHSYSKEFLLNILSKGITFQYKVINSCLITTVPCKISPTSAFLQARSRYKSCNNISKETSLSQSKQSHFSQPFHTAVVLQPLDHLCSHPLYPLTGQPFFYWGPRSRLSTPGGVSGEQRRRVESLPSSCWPRCF